MRWLSQSGASVAHDGGLAHEGRGREAAMVARELGLIGFVSLCALRNAVVAFREGDVSVAAWPGMREVDADGCQTSGFISQDAVRLAMEMLGRVR